MNWKFWQTENYNNGDYTDALVDYLIATAGNSVTAKVQNTAAVEYGVGLLERCFAMAEVTPDYLSRTAVTPKMLSRMVRQLLLTGNAVSDIDTGSGELLLLPASAYQVHGGIRERSWRYVLTLNGPSSAVQRKRPGSAVIHLRMGEGYQQPWRGYSPLINAGLSSKMLGQIEQRMNQESTAKVGQLLTIPDNTSDESVDNLRRDLAVLAGQIALVETGSAGHGQGIRAAPQVDWLLRRIGAHFPAENIELRRDLSRDIIDALGIPSAMYHGTDGVSTREAYRHLLVTGLQPIAEIISEEFSKKLDTTVSFKFTRLQAADIQSRARAFGTMIQSGIDEETALEVSGLEG